MSHDAVRALKRAPLAKPATAAHGGVKRRKANRADGLVQTGDGGVTAFHDNGGRILHHPSVVLMFWGAAWTNAATNPSQSAFTSAIENLIFGPWGTQLSQYRGIGPMALEKVVTIASSNPPATFTDPEIQAMIEGQINAGVVPAPANGVDRVYCVLMPTGHSSGDTPFVGQHQFF